MRVPARRTEASAQSAGCGPSPRSLGGPAPRGTFGFSVYHTFIHDSQNTCKQPRSPPPPGKWGKELRQIHLGENRSAGRAPGPRRGQSSEALRTCTEPHSERPCAPWFHLRDVLKQTLNFRAAPGSQHNRAESTGRSHVPPGRRLPSPSVRGGRARTPQGAAVGVG